MKKRVSDQVCRVEISKEKQKHQILLQDYLDLQKEVVSRKKKLDTANMRRRLLAAEVRFLRRRFRYLLTFQSAEAEAEAEAEVSHDTDAYDKPALNERRNRIVNENDNAKALGGAKDFRWDALKRSKNPKNCLVNGKVMGKRKISWQDPLALRV